jgi:hypothetical protein
MTKILGFSAKKQGGKTTTCNFLFGLEMVSLGMIAQMRIDEKGRLVVPIETGDSVGEGCLDPVDPRPEVQDWYAKSIWPFMKIYQFADPLKWICQEILGLTHEQCHGTNDDKNTLTKLEWENMPGVAEALYSGPMTGREVLQYVGTNIFRYMYPNVWVDATIRRIQNERPEVAIVSDLRFPNEVEGIQKAGGKVIRFKRAPFSGQDEHPSETALDDYPENRYDLVVDNTKMSITEQNQYIYDRLIDWEYLKTQVESNVS